MIVRMTIRILAALAVVLLANLSAHAQQAAPSRLDEIIKRGTLRVGMTGDYKPFTYFDKTTQQFSGFDVDMAEALGKALGVKVEYRADGLAEADEGFRGRPVRHRHGRRLGHARPAEEGLLLHADHARGQDADRALRRRRQIPELADIDKKGTRVIVNPGGTNERFARANIKDAEINVFPDNTVIFDEIAKGNADLMMTDASETRYQQKQHPGVLCAVHPDKPFDFSEKAYWLQRDMALKAFVDQWLHISMEDGSYKKIYAAWFD